MTERKQRKRVDQPTVPEPTELIKDPRAHAEVTRDLKIVADNLAEVALFECNPAHWFGRDMRPDQMMGPALDMRIKCKVNAASTVRLLKEVQQMISQRETGRLAQRMAANQTTTGDPDTVDSAAVKAQEEADRLIAEARNVIKMRKQG